MVDHRYDCSEWRRLRAAILLAASLLLPWGVARGQDYDAVGRRLRAAVAAEEITGPQARFMSGALRLAGEFDARRGMAEDGREDRISKEEYEHVEAELKQLVTDGKIPAAAARARLHGMREVMESQWDSPRGDKRKHEQGINWDAVQRRIEGAVQNGEMSREDADAAYRGIKKRLAGQVKRDLNWKSIKKRIEGAVERGDLTREEADAKYEALKKESRE